MERGSDPPPLAADANADAAATISGVASEACPASSACTPTSRSGTSGPARSARRRIPAPTSPPSAASSVSPMSPVSMLRGARSGSASAPRGGGASPPFVDGSVPAIHGASEGAFVPVVKDALSHCAPSDSAGHMMPPGTRRSHQPAAAAHSSSAPTSASGSSGDARRRAGSHRRSLSCPSHDALMADALQPLPAPAARMARCSGSSNNLALIAAAATTAPTPATIPSPNRHRVLSAASAGGRSAGSPPLDSPPRVIAATPGVTVNRRGATRPRGLDSSASFPAVSSSPVFTSFAPSVSATPASPVACPTTPSGLPPRSRKPAAPHSSAYPQASPRPASLDEPAMFASDGDRFHATSPTLARIEPTSQSAAAPIMASSPWARDESPRFSAATGRKGGFSPAVSPNALSPTAFAFPLQGDPMPSPHSVPLLNLPPEAGRTGKAPASSQPGGAVILNTAGFDARVGPLASDEGSDSDDDFMGLYETVTQRRAMVSAAHHMLAAAASANAAPTHAHSPAPSGRSAAAHGGPGVASGGGGGSERGVQGRSGRRRSMSVDFNLSSWAMELPKADPRPRKSEPMHQCGGRAQGEASSGRPAMATQEVPATAHLSDRLVESSDPHNTPLAFDLAANGERPVCGDASLHECAPRGKCQNPETVVTGIEASHEAPPSPASRCDNAATHRSGATNLPRPAGLQPLDAEEFRAHAHRMVDYIADYYRDIESYPVRSTVEPGYLQQHVPESAPEEGEPLHKILADVSGGIMPGITHWQSPSFFAFFPANSSTAALLADMLCSALNVTHSCVKKACQIAGLPSSNLRVLPTRASDHYALHPSTLQEAVHADTRAGLVPFFLTCTVGTTSSTAVDPIEPLAAIAEAHGMWVHVDAAYGGAACVCEEHRHHLAGVQHVQSLAVNAHKWLLTNFDCCCLWTQDTKAVQDALTTTPEYLRNKASDSQRVVDYKDWQVPLGRRFRALKLWFVLRMFGAAQLRAYIRHHVSLAHWFEAAVCADARFQLMAPRTFALVCFRLRPPGQAEQRTEGHGDGEQGGGARGSGGDEGWALNEALLEAVNSHIAMACCSLQLAAPTAAWKGQAQSLSAAGDKSSFFGRLPSVARSPLVADVAASRPAASRRASAAPRASSGLIGVSGDVVSPRAARQKIPPMQPVVMTPSGPADLMSAFLRNRIIFVGSAINQQMAQRVIQQLLALSAVDDRQDIKMYINCPGGSTYSVLAIYDCMAWIKPDVQTVAFGMTASQGALLLAAGTKGKRLAMPNARIMIHQPQGGCGGTSEDVRRQVNEVMASRDKLDKMFSAFTGQPVELIQKYTERDRFFSAAEAVEFGLIDGLLETEY
ncbi:unnamed protein product [Closterium sp. Yama58-4]|nr:unnamed protein product [Closterium sp. Yama58-4]